jgi:hypothetical protein
MARTIQALPSKYRGITFRSRMEARWAYYFDLLGCSWDYEPEAFPLPQGNYLPDFWCDFQGGGSFVEVKPNEEEFRLVHDKLHYLAMITRKQVICVVGPPSIEPQHCFEPCGEDTFVHGRYAIFCQYGFEKWGRPYYNYEIDLLCKPDRHLAFLARGLQFDGGISLVTPHA